MKETITEKIVQLLEIYNDVDELMYMVQQNDYEENDCFWYLDEYNIYSILDSRMMDRVISKKWQGRFDINSSFLDYSVSSVLYHDRFGLFASDRLFSELRHELRNFDRKDQTHQFKFHVWQNSMELRFNIDLTLTFIISGLHVFFLNNYNSSMLDATDYAKNILKLNTWQKGEPFVKQYDEV